MNDKVLRQMRILQLFHGESKYKFDKMMMSTLY